MLAEADHVSGFPSLPKGSKTNYAQVIIQVRDKEATPELVGPIQDELARQVPGAWITVRQLQTNPVETPVEILISGQADTDPQTERQDIQVLRKIASQVMDILGRSSVVTMLRDDWAPDSSQMKIEINPDRANLVGITNSDIAASTRAAISGTQVGTYKEGNKDIPIVARLRPQERGELSQVENLYVELVTRERQSTVALGCHFEEYSRDVTDSSARAFPDDLDIVLSRTQWPGLGNT